MLKFQRTDASFEIPKLLAVIDSIQKYVFDRIGEEPGDYTMFSSLLENEQVDERLRFLIDYGVPSSAVKKIKNIPDDILTDFQVIQYLRKSIDRVDYNLIAYEEELLLQAIR